VLSGDDIVLWSANNTHHVIIVLSADTKMLSADIMVLSVDTVVLLADNMVLSADFMMLYTENMYQLIHFINFFFFLKSPHTLL
jgi:hypothetical protein